MRCRLEAASAAGTAWSSWRTQRCSTARRTTATPCAGIGRTGSAGASVYELARRLSKRPVFREDVLRCSKMPSPFINKLTSAGQIGHQSPESGQACSESGRRCSEKLRAQQIMCQTGSEDFNGFLHIPVEGGIGWTNSAEHGPRSAYVGKMLNILVLTIAL